MLAGRGRLPLQVVQLPDVELDRPVPAGAPQHPREPGDAESGRLPRRTAVTRGSTKTTGEDGDWGHTSIRLEPLNPAHEPLVLTPDSEDEVRVLGEWVRNLSSQTHYALLRGGAREGDYILD